MPQVNPFQKKTVCYQCFLTYIGRARFVDWPIVFCTKHNGRQLGSKVFICNKLDVSKHPRSTLQHVMLNAAAMYRRVQCPAVNTQYYMIYYYISL